MSGADAAALHDMMERAGAPIWIDGGWAVDAVLGRQTRAHSDLDVVIEARRLPVLERLLRARGFADVPRDDASAWNFVLGHADGRQVDLHVVAFDAAGRGVMGPPENGASYPPGSLDGRGVIEGRRVRCVTPEHLVAFHTGYPLRERDHHDVHALCRAFALPLPAEYRARRPHGPPVHAPAPDPARPAGAQARASSLPKCLTSR